MRNLLITGLCFLTLILAAQQKPLDAESIQRVKEGVAAAAVSTNTISCDFTQEKEMSILNDKIFSSGKFLFKKEKQLRWEYIQPFSYIIVIRGDVIDIRDEGKVRSFNAQSNKVFAEVNKIILGSIRGTLLTDEVNFIASYFQKPGQYIVRLNPLSPRLKESLKEIAIFLNHDDFTVERLEMVEQTGDRTLLTFTRKQINQPIPDEKFILR